MFTTNQGTLMEKIECYYRKETDSYHVTMNSQLVFSTHDPYQRDLFIAELIAKLERLPSALKANAKINELEKDITALWMALNEVTRIAQIYSPDTMENEAAIDNALLLLEKFELKKQD